MCMCIAIASATEEKQPLGSSFNEKAYWSMNALLNKAGRCWHSHFRAVAQAYADRHGYGFTIAKPEHESHRWEPQRGSFSVTFCCQGWAQRPSESWFRVPFMQERLQAAPSC